MAPSWLACCVARESDNYCGPASVVAASCGGYASRSEGANAPAVALAVNLGCKEQTSFEDDLLFFDCVESPADLEALRVGPGLPPSAATTPPAAAGGRRQLYSPRPQEASSGGFGGARSSECCGDFAARDCTDLAAMRSVMAQDLVAARNVLERTREEWRRRVEVLRKQGSQRVDDLRKQAVGPELEWANLPTALRMLNANIGDVQLAVKMFVQALELRARDRHLFQTMQCEARSDVRIIGRDLEGHPVVYMCARSQEGPLGSIRDQFVITFEAACQLAGDMGTVAFVVDMHGLQPHLNMDFKAVKAMADMLGTVYAERICRITIVDFSRAAQAIWWMLKPMLRPATRQKFAFVSQAQARQLCKQQLNEDIYGRLCQTFEVNRDPNLAAEDRALHARRTTMCDVPLGPPLED